MATLIDLVESGTLDKIDPLEPGELTWRTLYATMDFLTWLEEGLPGLNHNELYSNLTPEEQVFSAFAEYVSGEELSTDRRFKKLSWTPDHRIWEFKTDEVRVFGWVPQKNAFICCFGDSADRIKATNSYGRYMAQTTYVRDNIDLDEPKYIDSGNYADVLSNATGPKIP
ncbi:hypothetical protein BMI85_06725 [Thioclava sp. DLFJ4-1]|nr:hypothetical protein BMI85_06725 [Thioclava sp. DLFJ4-1]